MFILSRFLSKTNRCHSLIQISKISTANKGQSPVNYCQSLVFDHPYLSYNDHCDQQLFQIFFLILFLFPDRKKMNIFISYKFFWNLFSLFSWNLNMCTKHKEQVCFLFICSLFTCLLFCNHSVY